MTGLSIATGAVVCQFPLPINNGVFTYFDMLRHPSDCMGAAAYRPDSNGGGGAAGIENLDPNGTKVYPNPFTDLLTIEASAPMNKLSMTDLQGKVIFEMTPLQKYMDLDLNELSEGIYVLEIHTINGIELIKVVK